MRPAFRSRVDMLCVCVCSNLSRVTSAWAVLIRQTLRCLKDLQGGLTDSATEAICATEAAKIVHEAKAKRTPQEKLIKLHEVTAVAEIEFFADMTSGTVSHSYRRHAGIVILSSFLKRGVSRQGSLSYIPLRPVQLGCTQEPAETSIHLCLASHKSQKSYGAMYHEYPSDHKPLLAWYLSDVRPYLLTDKNITWESTDSIEMLFPSEAGITKLMTHFWKTSSAAARSVQMSLSDARTLMCRDIQSLVLDPVFGTDVKELQMAAGTPCPSPLLLFVPCGGGFVNFDKPYIHIFPCPHPAVCGRTRDHNSNARC